MRPTSVFTNRETAIHLAKRLVLPTSHSEWEELSADIDHGGELRLAPDGTSRDVLFLRIDEIRDYFGEGRLALLCTLALECVRY